MRIVPVELGKDRYDIQIGSGLLGDCGALIAEVIPPTRVAVVTDDQVCPLYGQAALHSLEAAGFAPKLIVVPAGEQTKVLETVPRLYEEFFEHRMDRRSAVVALGGGVIGDYNHCSFRNPGTGSFLPLEGANPFSGTKGRVSYEPEFRLEVRVPRGRLDAAVAAMVAAHPYDEAAYDVYPLSGGDRWGLGRLAELPESMSLKEFAERCRRALRLRAVRFVGGARRRIRKVAVCTGSGNGLLTGAVSAGASAFVTGDVTYHAARDAEREGLALVDVGHFGSEHIFIGAMKKQLIRRFRQAGLSVEIIAFRGERDPFHTLQGG